MNELDNCSETSDFAVQRSSWKPHGVLELSRIIVYYRGDYVSMGGVFKCQKKNNFIIKTEKI